MKLSDKTRFFLDKNFGWFANPIFWIWFTPVLLITPNIGLTVTEYYSVWSKIANLSLPLGIYALLMSLSAKTGRSILYLIPIMFFGAFQIVLLFLFGNSIIAVDMYVNILTTSVSEATELLGNLKGAILTVCILYLPAITMGIVLKVKHRYVDIKQRRTLRLASYPLIGIGVASVIMAMIFADSYKFRRELFPYNVIENLGTAIYRTKESIHYYQTSRSFSYSPVMTRDKEKEEVFVIVIGETSRADNWQLYGYDRPTNPRLSKRTNIFPFSKVLTEINTTHKAVPMLLSYLTPENFGDSVAHTRSIFSAFNELGYRTAFLSNQRRNHSYIDYYGEEAQTAEFISDAGGPLRDFNLIEPMKQIIERSPNNKVFIVLHSYGSHFEYRKRYPGDMAYFTPDANSNADIANRDQLLNAYDNTIRYTDALLDSVITVLDRLDVPAAMMFVSDHGEDIFDDDRKRFLHSSPTPTYYQIHVPMIVWLSDEFETEHPELVTNLNKHRQMNIASTRSLFHTILDIAGVRTPFYDSSYSLTSPDFHELTSRRYLNDYNESIPLEQSGVREQDIEMFKNKNITY